MVKGFLTVCSSSELNKTDKKAVSFFSNFRLFPYLNLSTWVVKGYRWKVHYVSDRNGSLVKQSVATARAFYVVKVGCYSCYSPFLALYWKTLDLSLFFLNN